MNAKIAYGVAIIGLMGTVSTAHSAVIDDFDTPSSFAGLNSNGQISHTISTDTPGTRTIEYKDNSDVTFGSNVRVDNGTFVYNTTSESENRTEIKYTFGSPVDFSSAGEIVFNFANNDSFESNNNSLEIPVTIGDGANDATSIFTLLDETPNDPSNTETIALSTFSGVNLAAVTNLSVVFDQGTIPVSEEFGNGSPDFTLSSVTTTGQTSLQSVPVPASLGLLGFGLMSLGIFVRRRRYG